MEETKVASLKKKLFKLGWTFDEDRTDDLFLYFSQVAGVVIESKRVIHEWLLINKQDKSVLCFEDDENLNGYFIPSSIDYEVMRTICEIIEKEK